MPYVLRNEHTGEIAAAMLRNSYDILYFGVKWWPSAEEADAERAAFLSAWQYADESAWQVLQVDENKVKTMNVKLKNNPAYMVCMDASGAAALRLRDEA